MYTSDGRAVLSPTDLVGYLACRHLTRLDRAASLGRLAGPSREDRQLDVIASRGLEHEAAYLQRLRDADVEVVEIPEGDLAQRADATAAAMRAGAEVIYQATFVNIVNETHMWRGHADFLRRVDGVTELGPHGYEPVDTKLARHVHPAAVLQLCHYAEQVARVQGSEPDRLHVVLGGGAEEQSLLVREFSAYYRNAKQRFAEAALASGEPSTYPLPVAHCAVCRWMDHCDRQRLEDDHLTLVAGLTREQARRLAESAGITTLTELATSEPPTSSVRIGGTTLQRLRHQARLQLESSRRPGEPPVYEVVSTDEPNTGLGALPVPSAGDLFFDIEGDPFVGDDGLEYLFGVGWEDSNGEFSYRAFWAHDYREERVAFEALIDFIVARREEHPDMHVYHYAAYERTALGRLMGRYATRETEIDQLFRSETLVDLFRVVRQGLVVGSPSYSLKKLEPLYMGRRTADITDAGSSIVEYERWLQTGEPEILQALETYNSDDCYSTMLLRNWLEKRRREAIEGGAELSRPPSPPEAPREALGQELDEVAGMVAALGGGDEPPADDDSARAAKWLLAQLLGWHRREDKPEWWWYFQRVLRFNDDDLYHDTEAVAGLVYVGVVEQVKRSTIHRYRFDPAQEHKLPIGRAVLDPAAERISVLEGVSAPSPGTLVALDPVSGTLDLKRGTNSTVPHPSALIPGKPVGTVEHRRALRRVAQAVLADGIDGGAYKCARDLLRRVSPDIGEEVSGPDLRRPGEDVVASAIRLARSLKASYLPIQGPPGSGKTYIAAQMAVALAKSGSRIGITATSHKVICRVLEEILACANRGGVPLRIIQKADVDDALGDERIERTSRNEVVEEALREGDVHIVAGTSWLFTREGMDQSLDYLIVDEAGQMSLADVVAVSCSATSLVMVGDPQQLAQPSKGAHPPGASASGLEHVLSGAPTLAPDRGLFVDRTRRLHPRIGLFISELAYDDRLVSEPWCANQEVADGPVVSGSGLRWLPVVHDGNRVSSEEEVEAISQVYEALLNRAWTDHEGTRTPIGPEDILVVAPYNAQVSRLATALGPAARVGTVDKFQGQEAAVVVVSLAASTAENVPRGMDFLYSRNRLNVALSRARALGVLVCSPALLEATCRSVGQLRLVNALCRLAEVALRVDLPDAQ